MIYDYVIIAVLIGGGEVREQATIKDCVTVERIQARAQVTGERLWIFDPAAKKLTYAASFRCEKAGVPTS